MKKILKVIIILFVIVAALNFVFIKYEEITLNNEMKSLAKLNLSEDDYNTAIKTNMNYGKVEIAVKEYLNDYSTTIKKIISQINDKKLKNNLSAENYSADGPEFNNTRTYLEEYKKQLKENIDTLTELTSKSKTNSYINKQNVNGYYTKLYNKYIYKTNLGNEIANNTNELTDAVKNMESLVDKQLAVINFLSENRNWVIKDNNIIFARDEDLNKYNELISNIS